MFNLFILNSHGLTSSTSNQYLMTAICNVNKQFNKSKAMMFQRVPFSQFSWHCVLTFNIDLILTPVSNNSVIKCFIYVRNNLQFLLRYNNLAFTCVWSEHSERNLHSMKTYVTPSFHSNLMQCQLYSSIASTQCLTFLISIIY